jgi:RNA-directed DNA polymerase
LARRYVETFNGRTRPLRKDVVRFLQHDRGLGRAWRKYSGELSLAKWLTESQRMLPVAAASEWAIPTIESVGVLADWFQLTPTELEWFADLKAIGRKKSDGRLQHYRYRLIQKSSSDIRLIEAPKMRLKELQRQILVQILDKIPPHPAVHGFIKGRSIKTFAGAHVGQQVVLRMDLKNFFPSFPAARIGAFFRTAGYPESVADLLAGICTNAVPSGAWRQLGSGIGPLQVREAKTLYSRPHLPQGAPTSPALANLCTYRLDCRLSALARAVGSVYTRYADDLAFSGSGAVERRVGLFLTHVAAIVFEEGFAVQHRKTRLMRQGARQYLAGLVVNQSPNVVRADFDRLKAILTNCVRHGPESQNREAHPSFRSHLEGRVGFVEMINLAKGKRLRRIFEEIQWK